MEKDPLMQRLLFLEKVLGLARTRLAFRSLDKVEKSSTQRLRMLVYPEYAGHVKAIERMVTSGSLSKGPKKD
jgi:hypothetical protein